MKWIVGLLGKQPLENFQILTSSSLEATWKNDKCSMHTSKMSRRKGPHADDLGHKSPIFPKTFLRPRPRWRGEIHAAPTRPKISSTRNNRIDAGRILSSAWRSGPNHAARLSFSLLFLGILMRSTILTNAVATQRYLLAHCGCETVHLMFAQRLCGRK